LRTRRKRVSHGRVGGYVRWRRGTDQFERDPFAGLAHHVAGSDAGEQDPCLGGGKVLLRATGDEFEQQLMDL
jgi:hypothetical protein